MLSFQGIPPVLKTPHPPLEKRRPHQPQQAVAPLTPLPQATAPLTPLQQAVANMTPEQVAAVLRLTEATIPIFEKKQYVGNGVAISNCFVLTSVNCGDGRDLEMKPPEQEDGMPAIPMEMSVVFEAPEEHFKILAVSPFVPPLKPIQLAGIVKPDMSIQTRFDPSTNQKIIRQQASHVHHFLTPSLIPQSPRLNPQSPPLSPRSPPLSPRSPRLNPQSPPLSPRSPPLSPRSPRLSPRSPRQQLFFNCLEESNLAERGAPRMALDSGKVYAIHHDSSTLVNTFDIYARLQQAAIQEGNHSALSILKQIGAFDCKYVDITIPLDKDPDTKNPKVSAKNYQFGFVEKERCSMKIWPQHRLYEHQTYSITPLPPENSHAFEHFAYYLGREWLRTQQPPKELSVKIRGLPPYTLTIEPRSGLLAKSSSAVSANLQQPIQEEKNTFEG